MLGLTMQVTREDDETHVITFGFGRRRVVVYINGTVEYNKIIDGNKEESGNVLDGIHFMELIGWAYYTR